MAATQAPDVQIYRWKSSVCLCVELPAETLQRYVTRHTYVHCEVTSNAGISVLKLSWTGPEAAAASHHDVAYRVVLQAALSGLFLEGLIDTSVMPAWISPVMITPPKDPSRYTEKDVIIDEDGYIHAGDLIIGRIPTHLLN